LIVEGGARTLQSFLDKGLWDELRVETNFDMTVSDGTRAPLIPAEAVVKDTIRDGANQLVCYEKIIPEN
jgi:diaminohydroxyphosphoribosylaminopyrimidine deaminase/5-amino-6-(5-phosphoribosylamino)uracil reductase